MRRVRCWLAGWLVLVAAAAGAEPGLGARVVILANADDPDSLRIARHYAAARTVPEENIVALKLPHAETISWPEFVTLLWEPLMERLVRERWLDAIAMTASDPVGRRKYAPYTHRIAALVVCRGVPLKIAHDPALAGESLPFTQRAEFRTNAGAVDAELSLLTAPNYNINAFVPNPLFQSEEPGDALRHVVIVGRLDGATAEEAMGLVDRAVAVERTGLLGRAYIDLAGRDPIGDGWLESAARQLEDLHFPLTVDRAPGTFPAPAPFAAPVLYFGWYASDVQGPFTLPGFRFPPGAIALHIHSYSAGSLRTRNQGWVAPLVARGVTATAGNVNEPYLQFTHRPNLLLKALARGETLGRAAYYALNVLSWQAVLIGDPLYRPFAVPLAAQLENLPALPRHLAGYAVLRRMRELDAARRPDEARRLGVRALREVPNLAVGVDLARRLLDAGEPAGAANALGFVPLLNAFAVDEWGLAAEAARLLATCGRNASAVEVWKALLTLEALPRELRLAWLPEAEGAARAARETALAAKWSSELEALRSGKK